MKSITSLLQEPAGLRFNGAALAYAFGGYALGWYGLFHTSLAVNLAATLLLAHSMTIAAYLIHECGHNLVFRKQQHNTRLGRALSWLSGSSYGTYEDIRYKHFRHHVDNADVVWFDYERFFREHPRVLALTRVLEWFYIPAHDLIMHGVMMFGAFIIPQRHSQRLRNAIVIVVRWSIFFAVLAVSPKAALLYVLAYLLMMTILRFMDSIQHDYTYDLTLFEPGKAPRKGNFEWEQEHTFSNPQSFRHELPNWFTLNFGFHNAHHADTAVPWYRLPAKHRELFGDSPENVVPLSAQLKIFHRQRVRRVMDNHGEETPSGRAYLAAARRAEVFGGNAASFLTSF
ncbi:MAG: fatty acid desaturase [Gammaproteobacteria bacterium]|nr:fatty acid desaturase [Gammaproteobacteria bacterium]MDH4254707.1 fatty acid desaturase [Gammaproteobacteria bacterium]MDH5308810.1 fatty acid desaturase [Gammaproteobacteria bacterium]